MDAAAQGAAQGFILIGNIVANLIAVISFVAFLNAIIGWLGWLAGQEQLTFEVISNTCCSKLVPIVMSGQDLIFLILHTDTFIPVDSRENICSTCNLSWSGY